MKLYEITNEIRRELEAVEAAGGEVTAETEARLDGLGVAFGDKTESLALWHREQLAESAAIATEIERLFDRRAAVDRAAAWSKDYLLREMIAAQQTAMKTARVSVRVQKNSSPAIRVTCDVSELPERFRRTITDTHANRAAMMAAHKAGESLPPGVFAETGVHVQVS